jgi:hypothetical protein
LELHLSQSSELHETERVSRLDDQDHYLIYKHWTAELAGLTKGNAVAHAVVMGHLHRAKAEVIEIRKKLFSSSTAHEDLFQSSILPLNTQAKFPRGGREWIR